MPNISEQSKKIAASAELYDKSEAIGAKFDLTMDQVGELDAEIRDVLNGVSETADFSAHIIERLEIDHAKAENITKEVSSQLFQSIKDAPTSQGSPASFSAVSSLEQAGGFEIESDLHDDGETAQTYASREAASLMAGNRANMVNNIENPMPVAPQRSQPIAAPAPAISVSSVPAPKNPMKEPLASQLLHAMTGGTIPKPMPKPPIPQPSAARIPPADPVPQPPANLPTNDPYREPMK